ncbi:MAG: hypothetical protein M1830_009075 [Pleopsidium flavum]|nr:MAG: hypothetical protein M1830_010350 [Pleopsidium flavum]KAI9874967.1 MAG: hypothetical protein M1830_009075 [Pleopsidium flavum]
MPSIKLISLSLALATIAAARTDLAGCTSSISGPSVIYYVPGTGEICDIPDCGGGRAPPKTTNPACAAYQGTATYSPSFLPGFTGVAAASQKSDGQVQATSAAAAPVTQIGDGQVQAPTSTAAAVSQISDGQVQAPSSISTSTATVALVSQISDGQPQAPTSTATAAPAPTSTVSALVSQKTDGQVQAPTSTAAAVSQITDGQVQAPTSTAAAVSQISDGQPQVPTTLASTPVSPSSNLTAPASGTSQVPVAAFTGAATVFGLNKVIAGLAIGLAAGIAML